MRTRNGRHSPSGSAPTTKNRLLVDPRAWSRHGGTGSFGFAHRLTDEPAFDVDRLAALADRLPAGAVKATAAVQPAVNADIRPSEVQRGHAGDLLRHIAERDASATLYRIERDPEYGALLTELLDEFRKSVDGCDGYGVEGYVFVSAPNATTPAHVDHEHNLFLQLAGMKRFTIGEFPSPAVQHKVFEALYRGDYGATEFPPHEAVTYVLEPGDAVYVPPVGVHVVETGDSRAISLSVVFHTSDLDRDARVYSLNADLRRVGLRPRPPRERPVVDHVKAATVTMWRRARALGQRSAPSQ